MRRGTRAGIGNNSACERCAALYIELTRQAPGGTNRYDLFAEAVMRIDTEVGRRGLTGPGFAEFVRGVMDHDIYNFPTGNVDLAALPTVSQLKALLDERLIGQQLNIHHLIEKRFLAPVFGVTDVDSIPGVAMFRLEHVNHGGQNTNAVTSMLKDIVAYGSNYTQLSPSDVLDLHQFVYRHPQVNWPGLADAAQAWIHSITSPGDP